jgi:hypothetical protein
MHPFDVEFGTVMSGEGGGTTAVLGASGSVRVMTSKNAQSLQDFQGWGSYRGRLIPIPDRFESNPTLAGGVWIVATMPSRIQSDLEAVSGKLGLDLGFDYGAARVDDPNNKKGRVVDAETLVSVEFHGGGSYSQVSNTTNLTPYITSAANSVKSGVQSSYAYIQAQINYIQQELNVLRQLVAQIVQTSSNNKSTNSK